MSPASLNSAASTNGGSVDHSGNRNSPTTLGGSVGGGVTHQIRPIKKPSSSKKFIAPVLAVAAGLGVAVVLKTTMGGSSDKGEGAPVSAKSSGEKGTTDEKVEPKGTDPKGVTNPAGETDPNGSSDPEGETDPKGSVEGAGDSDDNGTASGEMVFISIESMPSGAEVVRAEDEEVLGTTPFHKEFPKGSDELDLLLKHDGYHKMEVTVGLDKDSSRRWTLKKRSSRSERKKSLFD